jgi:hypothetical protein
VRDLFLNIDLNGCQLLIGGECKLCESLSILYFLDCLPILS